MPDWEFNQNTKVGILWTKRGAITDHTAVVNTNTVAFDSAGDVISVTFPNPLATINLAGIAFKSGDHDAAREMMKHFNVKTGG